MSSVRPVLRLKPSQIEYPRTSMSAKGKSKGNQKSKQNVMSYSSPPRQKDEDKGDLPEKKREYSRGEQVDQFTVFFKHPTRRGTISATRKNVPIRWYAYRSSGSDNVKYLELISDIRKNKDNTFQLILNYPFLKKRSLPLTPFIEYLTSFGKSKGFEVVQESTNSKITNIQIIPTSSLDIKTIIMERLDSDPKALYIRGGVALMWGDFFPYFDKKYFEKEASRARSSGKQEAEKEIDINELFMKRDKSLEISIDEYEEYLEENKIKITKDFQNIISPKFGCLNRVGRMNIRGTCNSGGTYLSLTKFKTSNQGFEEFMNYMPDISVSKRISEYIVEKSMKENIKTYTPSSDIFSFQFNPRLKVPDYLKCDFAYSFVKLIETDPIMKLPLKDLPFSCAQEEICLPYLSVKEIEILKKLDSLMDIKDFESENIEYETQYGRRCRGYTFGSDYEDDNWETRDAEMERRWLFGESREKEVKYSPRSIRKDNKLYPYQFAFDELFKSDTEESRDIQREIVERRQAKIRELRKRSGIY